MHRDRRAIRAQYDAAQSTRQTRDWKAPSTGPNDALTYALPKLRNRSRSAHRNNPWINHGINRLVSNEVGTGIIPRFQGGKRKQREQLDALWDASAAEIDADRVLDVYGLQTLLSRTRRVAGEVFILGWRRRANSPLAVPMQVQVLEPDHVPVEMNTTAPNGNRIRAGIELDRAGRRVAYWMYDQHPQDHASMLQREPRRIPAHRVIHHYTPIRPGQLRGEPVTAQSLLKAHVFDQYDHAELRRKQNRSQYTGFITRNYDGEMDWHYDPVTGVPLEEGDGALSEARVEPGTMLTGLPGEDVRLFDGDSTGQGYADFVKAQIQGMAVGLEGIPYELLSGDWTGVNDRLVRAVLHEFRRGIESVQEQIMVHQCCRGMAAWWMDSAVLSGRINLPRYAEQRSDYLRIDWRPQSWPYLHPEQDIRAKFLSVKRGFSSRAHEVAKSGYDVEGVDAQNAEDRQRERELGLDYGYDEEGDDSTPDNDDSEVRR